MREFSILLFLSLLFASCSEDTHIPDPPEPIVSPGIEYILPNTVWQDRQGEAEPVYLIQFRQDPMPTPQEVCTMDVGAGEEHFSCGRHWELVNNIVIRQFSIDSTGAPYDVEDWRIDQYDENNLYVTTLHATGEGTPKHLERQ